MQWNQIPVHCYPDGLLACMYGSVSGNCHELFLLSKSGLMEKLQLLMPEGPEVFGGDQRAVYSLYGNLLLLSLTIFWGYSNLLNGSDQALGTKECQKCRKW